MLLLGGVWGYGSLKVVVVILSVGGFWNKRGNVLEKGPLQQNSGPS